MAVIAVLAAVFLLLLFIKMKTRRKKAAILIGYVVTLALLPCALLLLIASIQREIMLSLLAASYVSVIAFLVLWNTRESKKVYLLLCVPALCIAAGFLADRYSDAMHKIPVVRERRISLYEYTPFRKGNLLAALDEEPLLKIADNPPVLDGATALLPVYASFVQAVYQKSDDAIADVQSVFEKGPNAVSEKLVFCSGTEAAYDNLLEGRADLIFCTEPSDTQMEQFNEKDLKLKLVPIGKDAFVFFVNKKNMVDDITTANIRGIYSGKIKNWRGLGGKNQKIAAFQRQKNSGSQTMLEKIMGVPPVKPRMENVHGDMAGIISQVADYRNFSNAIGYSFLFYATEMVQNDQIKLLSIDGIYPSKETIQDNQYPFSGNFYAIYIDRDEKNENIESFIDWILSRQGQELIAKTGYVPVSN